MMTMTKKLFKVGDRVYCDEYGSYPHETGTIKLICRDDISESELYLVVFDEYNEKRHDGRHNGKSYCEKGFGWFFFIHDYSRNKEDSSHLHLLYNEKILKKYIEVI